MASNRCVYTLTGTSNATLTFSIISKKLNHQIYLNFPQILINYACVFSVFFIEIDCPQLIKYLIYLTRLKNEKSQKATPLKNLIVSQRRLRKVSYPAHIPYAQPHERAN